MEPEDFLEVLMIGTNNATEVVLVDPLMEGLSSTHANMLVTMEDGEEWLVAATRR